MVMYGALDGGRPHVSTAKSLLTQLARNRCTNGPNQWRGSALITGPRQRIPPGGKSQKHWWTTPWEPAAPFDCLLFDPELTGATSWLGWELQSRIKGLIPNDGEHANDAGQSILLVWTGVLLKGARSVSACSEGQHVRCFGGKISDCLWDMTNTRSSSMRVSQRWLPVESWKIKAHWEPLEFCDVLSYSLAR